MVPVDTDHPSGAELDRRRDESPGTWAVEVAGTDCDHPTDSLRAVGDDGQNAYHACEQCDSILVARLAAAGPPGGLRPL